MLRLALRYMITDRRVAWINEHRIRWEDRVDSVTAMAS
jgi:hypothetical protein